MKLWRRSWEQKIVLEPVWVNIIIVYITVPLFCELVGRAFEIEYMGLVIGVLISITKTMYDYIRAKYFDI